MSFTCGKAVVILPFTVLASVPRLTRGALVASIPKTLTSR